ncbi:MAG: indolepyruvate ferredoxin oxidoreductase [Bacteroidales bacterium]|nr:indolepyruvate ferredoxin oxidoreductase [Bacteroidales bacterium]
MQKKLLLGVEAIAQGAIDGGLSGVYAYPGTPSTEITEYIESNPVAIERNLHRQWSANEKTAMEAALGMSYAGKRAMVCMKHVGMNVCADAFVNSAVTGINGGIVVVAADDPSMHSSQNEQDSRFYGDFAMITILEPSTQQQAYDMAYSAFEISEKTGLPVLIRITTRLAHSRSTVETKELKSENEVHFPADPRQFVLLPAIAKRRYANLLKMQEVLGDNSEKSTFNTFEDANSKTGIVACGIAYNYLKETFNGAIPYPTLHIGQYPLPIKQIEKLAEKCDEIIVVEEGYPFVEQKIKGISQKIKIKGKLDGTLPRQGELNPDITNAAFGIKSKNQYVTPELVSPRPPALCQGCSHADMYEVLNQVMQEMGSNRVFGDIGCYTLGALPPYVAINSTVDMGASITMAKGAADSGVKHAVAVIGDSTFVHSGMTGLLDAVIENTPITVIISDNSTTAMTGGQKSHGENRIEKICLGLGVEREHLHIITPMKNKHEEMFKVIKQEVEYQGVSVIISQRECIRTAARKAAKKRANLK